MNKPTFPLPFFAVAAMATLLAGAGCGSPAVPRDLMAEEARSGTVERPVAMKGEGSFDGGNVHVVATVARGFMRGPGKTGHNVPRERKGWFRHDTDAFSENYSFDYGDSEEEQKEAVEEYIRQAMARRAAGSPMPPVTLNVTFENRGAQPIEIVPTDVNSDLGNFAVRPPKLTLAPGEKGALEPMVSQLGVTSDEIPLTVGIRVGGKTESHVILVKNILAPSVRNTTTAAGAK
jgi:hypothetical protein